MNRKGLEKKAATRGGNHYHVIFCAGKPKGKGACCDSEEGMKVWKYLGKRLSALKKQGKPCFRTLTDCLCFCVSGPVMVIYPEGVWYGEVTLEACEKIIEEHLVNGRIATEYALAVNPLVPNNCPKSKKETK